MNVSSSMVSCVLAPGISSRGISSKVCHLPKDTVLTQDDVNIWSKALGYFNWVCWIVPNNIVVNQLFGYNTGLVSYDEYPFSLVLNDILFIGHEPDHV